MPTDSSDRPSSNPRLLPIREAAIALGMSAQAVRSRLRRGTLNARRGNSGWLVEVPADASAHMPATSAGRGADHAPAHMPANADRNETYADALVEELRTALDRERARADRLEHESVQARAEAVKTALDAAEAKGRVDVLSGRIEALERDLADARRPWWRRLLNR